MCASSYPSSTTHCHYACGTMGEQETKCTVSIYTTVTWEIKTETQWNHQLEIIINERCQSVISAQHWVLQFWQQNIWWSVICLIGSCMSTTDTTAITLTVTLCWHTSLHSAAKSLHAWQLIQRFCLRQWGTRQEYVHKIFHVNISQ